MVTSIFDRWKVCFNHSQRLLAHQAWTPWQITSHTVKIRPSPSHPNAWYQNPFHQTPLHRPDHQECEWDRASVQQREQVAWFDLCSPCISSPPLCLYIQDPTLPWWTPGSANEACGLCLPYHIHIIFQLMPFSGPITSFHQYLISLFLLTLFYCYITFSNMPELHPRLPSLW